jgi:hypothetical protein
MGEPRNIVDIARDVYARLTLVRRTAPSKGQECGWCGRMFERRKLFQYGIQPDSIGGSVHWLLKHFCSVGCARAYYPELPFPKGRR